MRSIVPPRIEVKTRALGCALLVALAIGATACSDDTVAPTCGLDIGHEYEGVNTSLDLVLDHNCADGTVTGTLYDTNSFSYDLTGSVTGDEFSFRATRERPSGTGVDTYRSLRNMEVLSGGLILRGVIVKNGIGPNEQLRFARVSD